MNQNRIPRKAVQLLLIAAEFILGFLAIGAGYEMQIWLLFVKVCILVAILDAEDRTS